MILLDTDHLSILIDSRQTLFPVLAARMTQSADQNFVACIVSLEEQMQGWLNLIRQRRRVHEQIRPYQQFTSALDFFARWHLLPFDERAADLFEGLRARKVRIGAQDLKIASIALANDATLLTANLVDFEKVPGLRIEDWLH